MMEYHWIVPLAAAIASLTLGVLVDRFGPRTMLRDVFTFSAVALAFWNLLYVVLYSVSNYQIAYELSRVIRCGAIFLFPAVLHLTIVAPGRPRAAIIRHVLVADYLLAIGLVIANAFDLVVKELRVVQWGYYSAGTVLYDLFTVYVFVNFTLALGLLVYEYRTTVEPRTRLQLKFWLLGLAIALPLGLTNLLPVYGIPFYPLGNIGSVAWAGIVAYAIARHRLMDIEVAVTKSIAYAGVSICVVGPAAGLAVLFQRWAFGEFHYDFTAAMVVLLLAVGVLFPALRLGAEARLERSLFPQKREDRAVLNSFARSIIRILDREKLVRELCDTLAEVLRLDRIALFLLDDVRGKFEVWRVQGPPLELTAIGTEHPFVRWLAQRGEPVLRDEVEFGRTRVDLATIIDMFRTNGWEVCVPFVSGQVLVGFIGLGRKRDLGAFSAGDLDILAHIGAEATIAFENARLYEELRRSRDVINRAGRLSALGTLAAGIAHEIRNPLVSIHTFFQLAPQRLDDEEFMSSFLHLAEGEVQRISNLINELLTFAKSPTATVGEVDLDYVVDRTLTLLAPQARSQHVELTRASSAPLLPVLADSDQIMQVLINLVLNAIEATPAGGSVAVETRQVEDEGGVFCRIEVRDTGSGISAELRENIFNPFFTTKDKGTGLGLSIAHRIVAEAGGFITVDSVEGQGSRFAIHLPVAPSASADTHVPAVRHLQG